MFKSSRVFKILTAAVLMFMMTVYMFSVPAQAGRTGGGKNTSNSAPVITQGENIAITIDEDNTGSVILSATDANRDNLSWSIITGASNGTASKGSTSGSRGSSQATFNYMPKLNYFGPDSFAVQVSDGKGGVDTLTVSITVKPVNDKPVNTELPGISGAASPGSLLTASTGTWTDDTTAALTYTYQWQQADDANGLNTADIKGQANSSYAVTEGNAGKYIRVKVTAQDNEGLSNDAYSAWVLISPVVPPVTKTISYVALGDSIATGTVYPGKTITTYVSYFYQFLQEQNSGAEVTLKNLATDGARTNELYSRLGLDSSPCDSGLVSAVENADIITISIGGNNLMQAAKDSSALGGYNFNNIDTTAVESGVSDFNAQWKPIINEIKRLNPDVQIIVITIYNPYNESDVSLHNTVDSYLFRADGTGINDVIRNNTGLGYYVADVYEAFNQNYSNNMGAITYFYPSPFDIWGTLTRNPHPNESGQNIITGLHENVYLTNCSSISASSAALQ